MAILIGCDNIGLDYPTKHVFDAVTLGVNEGDRIGIVGRNGDGKSSLLGVLARTVEPDQGRVTWRRDLAVGVLGQADQLDDARTVGENVVGELPEYEWAASTRIRGIIAGLIADVPWDAPVGTLSGGQRRRVDLARLLIGTWDVLMLDEPTNHLDVRAIAWLARHLASRWQPGQGALLVVTHDRWFLDAVCEHMWEVHDGRVEPFEGGYSAYILQRVERDRAAAVAEQRRQNMIRKELAWLSRGAQARSTKAKFRVDAARALIADDPPVRNALELKRLAVARLGKQVIDLENVSVSFPARAAGPAEGPAAGEGAAVAAAPDALSGAPHEVLSDITWLIGPGDRYGVLGENGAGKSTLLRVLEGRLAPTRGRVKIGQTVKFGTLSQQLTELAPVENDTLREILSRYKRTYVVDGKETSPEKLLERLGFSHDQLLSRPKDLSGGQRRRLQLLLTILAEPNVLILDEPGNDLDTDMLAIVEDLLDGWPGTLILVSHDRYLMERVTDQQYALIDGRLRHVPGGVDEYLRLLDERDAAAADPAQAGKKGDSAGPRASAGSPGAPAGSEGAEAQGAAGNGLTRAEEYRLKKQLSSLERKMETQRSRTAELEEGMAAVDPTDYQALEDQQVKIDAARAALDELENEWLYLSERLEG